MTEHPPGAATDHRPVVVGLDGSPGAGPAAAFATEEARLRGAPLLLVHALSWPREGLALPAAPGVDLDAQVRSGAEAVLRAAAGTAEQVLGPGRVGWAVDDADPVTALRAAAAGAGLLVVGSRGAGGVPGLLLGSTADGLAMHAPCPVAVLPSDTSVVVRGRRSVVVGVEGRPGDDRVLAVAFAAAAARGTDVLAVHAWQDAALETAFESVGPLTDWAGVLAEEERLLAEALAGRAQEHPDVVVREVVVRDRPPRALTAAALTAQLLVVGHRHHRLGRFGSTTHGVLHRVGCPLVVVPLDGSADGSRW